MNHVKDELLNKVKTLLSRAQQKNIDDVEITAHYESGFCVSARQGDVENIEHHQEKSVSITVYKDQRSGSASTSDLSNKALTQTLEKACSIAKFTEPDPFAGLADNAMLAFDYPELELDHPWNISPEKAIKMAVESDKAARAMDKRITQTESADVTTTNYFSIYANSRGFIGFYPSTLHSLSLSLIAEENGNMERDYTVSFSRQVNELDSPETIAVKAAEKTVRRLGARKITTRQCPVIFENRAAKSLLKHFIAAISGTNLYRQSSFLVDGLGSTIFPKFINIYQQPHIKSGYGSAPFDSQGVKTRDLHYVKNGQIENYVLGNYSAKKLGLTTTGNAGGVFNLFISHRDDDLQQLCKKMGTGLLVTELMGQGVNLLTGDYSRGAAGFWVENGEIQYPVHEITVSGNLKTMFAGIKAIGNDIEPQSNIQTGSILIDSMTIAGSI